MKKKLVLLLAAALLAALLTACGAANGSTAAVSPPAEAAYSTDAYESGLSEYASGETQSSAAVVLPDNVKMIYRADMSLETTEFEAAVKHITELTAALGGYFESSDVDNYDTYRTARYVVRVPSGNFQRFCESAGKTCSVRSFDSSEENIGEAYYDAEARLATQRTKLARLQALLAQAEDMADIITLEGAISDTEYQIELLSGTLRRYDSLVDYSTVSISLREVYRITETEEPAIGFGARLAGAFRDGAVEFVEFLEELLLAIASAWVVLLILAAVIVAAVLLIRRQVRRNRLRQQPVMPPAGQWNAGGPEDGSPPM